MKNVTRIITSLLLLVGAFNLNAQTIIIDPTTAGGFESGADFAANGWTATTGTATQNQWVCNTGATIGFSGTNCAYVTNNTAGVPPPHTYSTGTTRVSHIYRTISVPSGETLISLNFNWINLGETTFDRMRIWLVPTSFTPVYGTQVTSVGSAPTGNVQLGLTNYSAQSSWASAATIIVPSAYAGAGNVRLIIEWRNDGGGGSNPPAAIDNISLTSSCSSPVTGLNASAITSTSATLGWTAVGGATSYNVRYKKTSDATSVSTWATPTNTVTNSLPVSSLDAVSTYEFQVSAVGVSCAAYTASTNFGTRPTNDDPCDAISITPGSSCSFTQYSNANATGSTTTVGGAIPVPGCSSYLGGDVWF